jgi:hypothetical protein
MVNYSTDTSSVIMSRLDILNGKVADSDGNIFSGPERAEIVDALSSLQSRVSRNPATLMENTDADALSMKAQIAEAKEDLQISKERVSTLRNPDKQVNYYESWFPINRPLRNSSTIAVLLFGIFFYCISLFMLLNTFGFSFSFTIPVISPGLLKLFPYGAILVIIGLIIMSVIAWLRKA